MELVIGRAGVPHISGADLGAMYRGLYGDEDMVLSLDDKMPCTVIDANTVEIGTGGCMLQGHFARISPAEQVKIENGAPGYKRNDLVVARYTLGEGNIQDVYLAVIKGVATVGTPTDPEYAEGDIDSGAILVEFPLWRIPIDGVNVGTPERIMPIASSVAEIRDSISQNIIEVESSETSMNVAANGFADKTANFTLPEGYKLVGVTGIAYWGGDNTGVPVYWAVNGENTVFLRVRNVSAYQQGYHFTVKALAIRKDQYSLCVAPFGKFI